ncbi:MAG TPA: NAD(P)-dependent oxidoreductase [Rariglobus sp.]|nr:NAD(P)-dependent oxidoreductase [Rariglobus sp.]
MSRACPPLPAEDLAHVLTHTGAHWEALRGKRLFITGGTGFFGMWLLETFAHANTALGLGAEAVVLTRDPAAFARKAPHFSGRADLTFIAGDVRDFAFPSGVFSHIIHAATAASARLNDERPDEMLDVIVGGTRRVLAFAEQAGVESLLLTSSGAVYGPQPPDLANIPEDYSGAPDPLVAATAYGQGKRLAEHLCAVHASRHGYAFKLARCFAFVGPHLPLDAHFAVGNFIRDALSGGPIRVGGDGTPYRSYLYAADLAVWLWTILFAGTTHRAYNVGSPEAVSIRDLAQTVLSTANLDQPVLISRPPVPGLAALRYVPSTERVRVELNLHNTITLESALRRTLDWHRIAKELAL